MHFCCTFNIFYFLTAFAKSIQLPSLIFKDYYMRSSLESAFVSIRQIKASNNIPLRIEESLKIEVGNRIDFENAILKDEKKLKVNQKCITAR